MSIVRREAIPERDEGNHKRAERLKKVKRGPGVFVYDGTASIVLVEPTPLYDKTGTKVGEVGGPPSMTREPLSTYVIRGKEFPKGKHVIVDDGSLAVKLRCMGLFSEVEGDSIKVETEPTPEPEESEKRKPGRPRKSESAGL